MNIVLLVDPSSFCESRYVQPIVDALVWMSWNTVLLILVSESHGTNLIRHPDRHDGVVWDQPLTVHWPKLLVWGPFTGTPSLRPAIPSHLSLVHLPSLPSLAVPSAKISLF